MSCILNVLWQISSRDGWLFRRSYAFISVFYQLFISLEPVFLSYVLLLPLWRGMFVAKKSIFCHNHYQSRTSNGVCNLHCSWQSQLVELASQPCRVLPRFGTTRSTEGQIKSGKQPFPDAEQQQLEDLLVPNWLPPKHRPHFFRPPFQRKERITV